MKFLKILKNKAGKLVSDDWIGLLENFGTLIILKLYLDNRLVQINQKQLFLAKLITIDVIFINNYKFENEIAQLVW